jgi:hypothetical protein
MGSAEQEWNRSFVPGLEDSALRKWSEELNEVQLRSAFCAIIWNSDRNQTEKFHADLLFHRSADTFNREERKSENLSFQDGIRKSSSPIFCHNLFGTNQCRGNISAISSPLRRPWYSQEKNSFKHRISQSRLNPSTGNAKVGTVFTRILSTIGV